MPKYNNDRKEAAKQTPSRGSSRGMVQKRAQTKKQYEINPKGPGKWNRPHPRKQNNDKKTAKQAETEKRNDTKVTNKQAAKVEVERAQREKMVRVQEYKKKRQQKNKVISKKTRHGQPLMKDRMNLLLEQIQAMKRS